MSGRMVPAAAVEGLIKAVRVALRGGSGCGDSVLSLWRLLEPGLKAWEVAYLKGSAADAPAENPGPVRFVVGDVLYHCGKAYVAVERFTFPGYRDPSLDAGTEAGRVIGGAPARNDDPPIESDLEPVSSAAAVIAYGRLVGFQRALGDRVDNDAVRGLVSAYREWLEIVDRGVK